MNGVQDLGQAVALRRVEPEKHRGAHAFVRLQRQLL
jgi:hypothetical protein